MVALRKESVDRNVFLTLTVRNVPVALRKESVDRNREQFKYVVQCRKSLSARRAWIEMMFWLFRPCWNLLSLSARRAWIEIFGVDTVSHQHLSSLSARRAWIEISNRQSVNYSLARRSPQGERG